MKIKIFSILLIGALCFCSTPNLNASSTSVLITQSSSVLNDLNVAISFSLAKGVTIDDILIDLQGQGFSVTEGAGQGNTFVINFDGTKGQLITVLNTMANKGCTITGIKAKK